MREKVTAPSGSVVDLELVKSQIRVDHSDDDILIQQYIDAAVARIDAWGGASSLALLPQTWRETFGSFQDRLLLPVFPVLSISSVTYFDGAGTQQVMSAQAYRLSRCSDGVEVFPTSTGGWSYAPRSFGAVTIEYVAGHDADDPALHRFRQAILLNVASLYEQRESSSPERYVPSEGYRELVGLIGFPVA